MATYQCPVCEMRFVGSDSTYCDCCNQQTSGPKCEVCSRRGRQVCMVRVTQSQLDDERANYDQRMRDENAKLKKDTTLPKWCLIVIEEMAYDRGHAAGEMEVLAIENEMIRAFQSRYDMK